MKALLIISNPGHKTEYSLIYKNMQLCYSCTGVFKIVFI